MKIKKRNLHIVLDQGFWKVKTANAKRSLRRFRSKASALSFAYHNSLRDDKCMFVHDEQGKIRTVKCPKRDEPSFLKIFKSRHALKYS